MDEQILKDIKTSIEMNIAVFRNECEKREIIKAYKTCRLIVNLISQLVIEQHYTYCSKRMQDLHTIITETGTRKQLYDCHAEYVDVWQVIK